MHLQTGMVVKFFFVNQQRGLKNDIKCPIQTLLKYTPQKQEQKLGSWGCCLWCLIASIIQTFDEDCLQHHWHRVDIPCEAAGRAGTSRAGRGLCGGTSELLLPTSRFFPEKALVAAAAAGCVLWQNLHGTKTSSAAPGHCTLPFLLLQSFKGRNVFLLLLKSRERAKIVSVHFHLICTLHFAAPLLWYIYILHSQHKVSHSLSEW